MALKLIEGFNRSSVGLATDYDRATANIGRNGTGGSNQDSGSTTIPLEEPIAEGARMVVGFACKRTNIFDDGFDMIQLKGNNGASIVWRLRTPANYTLGFYAGGFRGAYWPSPDGFWQYWEVEVLLHQTAGEIKVWVDGNLVSEATGVKTMENAVSVDHVQLIHDVGDMYWYADDLYVLDDTGTEHTSRLGDVHVVTLDPTSAGTHSDGAGSDGDSIDNHLLIDDGFTVDEADHVKLQVNDRESFGVADLGAGEVPVAVQVVSHVTGGNGIDTTVDGFIRLGGVDYDAADPQVVLNLTPKQRRWIWQLDPSTAAAWLEDAADGIEGGVRRTA